jgi:quercetin dioxygenase-like cupin family protein
MSNPFDMDAACPPVMTVHRAGSGVARAPDGVANSSFWVEMLLSSRTDGDMTAMRAYIEPGIITHWHSHPRGQLLFVLDGVGRVQRDGGDVIEVRSGDSVWFAPDERHWHGAAPASPFSYVSVQGVKDGTAVRWMEPVENGDTQ